ncbi:hypothetical protein HJG60_010733 [Phyllostomus discolor]|uniref:Uncharacterized protein n=1 Tax=Phyllostomus discolor TaxID=89673 RepID=A0A834AI07_9CHIR|nr:hypothetical protein HJG60_010733 [Phyllostomus discolor]
MGDVETVAGGRTQGPEGSARPQEHRLRAWGGAGPSETGPGACWVLQARGEPPTAYPHTVAPHTLPPPHTLSPASTMSPSHCPFPSRPLIRDRAGSPVGERWEGRGLHWPLPAGWPSAPPPPPPPPRVLSRLQALEGGI